MERDEILIVRLGEAVALDWLEEQPPDEEGRDRQRKESASAEKLSADAESERCKELVSVG